MNRLRIIAFTAAAFAFAALVSCDPKETEVAVTAVEITAEPSPLTLIVGGATGKVTGNVTPADATDPALVWTIAPEGVATLAADGTVTAVAPGTATITATAPNGVKGTCTVTVAVPEAVVYTYKGTFNVSPGTADEYTDVGKTVTLTIAADRKKADLVMFKPIFADGMPEMDITIPTITVAIQEGGGTRVVLVKPGYTLSGETIVPTTVMGGKVVEVARYTMTGFSGTATEETITFNTKCGTYDLSFSGTAIPATPVQK